MKPSKIISILLWLFIVAPIWYYLFYKILIAVNASELMMFLYWIYVPSGIMAGIIAKVSDGISEKKEFDIKSNKFAEKLENAMKESKQK